MGLSRGEATCSDPSEDRTPVYSRNGLISIRTDFDDFWPNGPSQVRTNSPKTQNRPLPLSRQEPRGSQKAQPQIRTRKSVWSSGLAYTVSNKDVVQGFDPSM
ncbi:hypothetical protein CPB84DRAFT_1775025 [Gymnopilus junonius]|uniref:Uncharacterized protein n=1 Tax=Gymnopilus junonius TaxID=109634 RepID=A0A9P5TQA0_GYMJU|nr:hypothetical protein CPB84DRAFT_1775025 [Gymnopilus junonius]